MTRFVLRLHGVRYIGIVICDGCVICVLVHVGDIKLNETSYVRFMSFICFGIHTVVHFIIHYICVRSMPAAEIMIDNTVLSSVYITTVLVCRLRLTPTYFIHLLKAQSYIHQCIFLFAVHINCFLIGKAWGILPQVR
jgi:hypothetical protein